jgi:hypothetical protein
MTKRWYVDFWDRGAVVAKRYQQFRERDFDGVVACIASHKASGSTEIARVLSPATATHEQRRSLAECGAVIP